MFKSSFVLCACLALFGANAAAQTAAQLPKVPEVVSGGVLNGKAKNLVTPEYPEAAKAVRASGAVNVQVTIDENGDVISAAATSGHPLLRPASVAAARASKFTPTQLSGQLVKVTGIIVYNFAANGAAATETAESRAAKELHLLAGMFLSIYVNAEPHPNVDRMLDTVSQMLPAEFAVEKRQLNSLPGDANAKRERVAAIAASIGGKLTGDAAQQFSIGQSVGEVAVEARNFRHKPNYQPDQDVVRRNLLNIKNSLSAPPADLSKTTVNLLQRFAAHADHASFNDEETLKSLMQAFEQLLQNFMPSPPAAASSRND